MMVASILISLALGQSRVSLTSFDSGYYTGVVKFGGNQANCLIDLMSNDLIIDTYNCEGQCFTARTATADSS
jgi:hypothetical protein